VRHPDHFKCDAQGKTNGMKGDTMKTAGSIVAVAVLWFIVTSAAVACPACVLDSGCFKLPHAHALSIAVAVVAARERGFLFPDDPPDHQRPMEIELNRFADAAFGVVGRRATAQAGGIQVVLVDEPALYMINKLPGLTVVSKQIVCPRRTPAVRVVTASPVIRAIAQGDLSLALAVELNVLEVEVVVPAAHLPLEISGRQISATP
jgi:hypothetical protein